MKLKYYLRGLGIGILITTIIFIIGIHVNQDQMFSDEEVIRRAKALGMVMDETDGKTINELDKDKKQDSESKDQKDSQKEDSKESKSDNKDKQEQAKDDQTKNDQTKADAESEKTQDSDAAAAQKQTVEQVEVSILPEPDGPMIATTSPSSTPREMSCSTSRSSKLFFKFSISNNFIAFLLLIIRQAFF